MSTYSTYEGLQLKKENSRSMPQETQQIFFKFVKNSKGKINFRATPSAPPPAGTRQTRLSRLSSTQSNYLWWLAISYLSCMPTPLRSRTKCQYLSA